MLHSPTVYDDVSKPANMDDCKISKQCSSLSPTEEGLTKPTVNKQQEVMRPLLTLRSPLDPNTEYRVSWAKKSLWQRRLEMLQQRYPSDRNLCGSSDDESCSISDDEEDDMTFLMDGSSSTYDRWGNSSQCSLPIIRRVDSDSEGEEEEELSHRSCPQFSRWVDQDSIDQTRNDMAPLAPSRAPSPVGDESLRDDSNHSKEDDGTWLDGFYSHVRELRERHAAAVAAEATAA